MPRICAVCNYPGREEIDRLLVEGEPYRSIAKQFTLSEAAVYRHKGHLNGALTKAKEAEAVSHADNLLDQVKDLQAKALSILSQAEAKEDYRAATGAIREARGCLELLAKLLGELNDRPQVNILISPEWTQLRTLILEALEPYPQARVAIGEALEGITNGSYSA